MSQNILKNYDDTPFFRYALEYLEDAFDGDERYLPITMKMLLHDAVFQALQKGSLLQETVFHGGTCLQRMYNWSRLSEDLDFANIAVLDEKRFSRFSVAFEEAIRKELVKTGFSQEQITVKKPKNLDYPGNNEPEVRKWEMKVNVGPRNFKQMVKIELVDMPSYDYAPRMYNPLSEAFNENIVMVNVEPLNVIFNDKVISILQRPYVKYRDIYDVGLLATRETIDSELFCSKMRDRHYTFEMVEEKAKARKEELSKPETITAFKSEMSRFYIPKRTVDLADDHIVREILKNTIGILDAVCKLKPDNDNGDNEWDVSP